MSRNIPNRCRHAPVARQWPVICFPNGLLLATALAIPGGVSGAEWTNSISTSLRQTYTDNRELDDNDEESDWITSVTPGVAVRGEGARLSLNFNYGFNFNHHTSGTRTTSANHRLQSAVNTELADKWLFVDARATATQTLVEEFQNSGGDTINNSGNTENTFTWEVRPNTRHRLGSYADAYTGVAYNEVRNSTSSDSKGVNAEANLQSGAFFPDVPWSLQYRYEKDFAYGRSGKDSEYEVLDATLGYIISPVWRIEGGAGREWNEFVSSRSDNDGTRWNARIRWTPTGRTSLTVGYSDRFYGSYPTLDLSHRSRRSVWTANYQKSLSNARQLRLANEVFQTEDEFGNPILDPVTGDPLEVNTSLADSTADIFVNEVFTTSYSLATGRTTASLNIARSERQYQDSSRDTTTTSTRLILSRTLSGLTNATADLGWTRFSDSENPDEEENREHDTLTGGLELTHSFTQQTNVGFSYRFRYRDSNVADDDYTENRVSVFLTSRWQ